MAKSKRKSEVVALLEAQRHKVAGDFARRHPERARAERRLKQANEAVRRDFGHKLHGTPETHASAARLSQGSLARLFVAGHIGIDQLSAAGEIAGIAEHLGSEVRVRTMNLEGGARGHGGIHEPIGRIRREIAYKRWCAGLHTLSKHGAAPVLAMIVEDLALRAAARRWRMRDATARALLGRALDLWGETIGAVVKEVDREDVDRVVARID